MLDFKTNCKMSKSNSNREISQYQKRNVFRKYSFYEKIFKFAISSRELAGYAPLHLHFLPIILLKKNYF